MNSPNRHHDWGQSPLTCPQLLFDISFMRWSVEAAKLFYFCQNRFHFLPLERSHGLGLDVAYRSQLDGKSTDRLVIGRVKYQNQIVRAHGPERVDDLDAHLFCRRGRGASAVKRKFNITGAQFGELKETNVVSHNA